MNIDHFRMDDIPRFLELAAAENWVAEPWEFEFLLAQFPRGCCAARGDNGETAGFVTSLRHDRSGWIGNLIVAAEYRGQRIGERLFTTSLDALRSDGVETIWLTASKSGQSLYEKYGFTGIDTIIRWVGTGRQRHAEHGLRSEGNGSGSSVSGIDCRAWGDRRDSLLAETVGRGRLLFDESGFAVVQPCVDARQIGPFSALDAGSAERLFDDAAKTVAFGTKVLVDSPVSNRSALRLFNRKKMRIAGSNTLMYVGKKPDYRAEMIYGLATMGSCG
ncbi:MAG: GNAT family N-acetyltransferase [Pelobacteraceae bacterium]